MLRRKVLLLGVMLDCVPLLPTDLRRRDIDESAIRERSVERANVSVYIRVSGDEFCLGGRGNHEGREDQVGFLFITISGAWWT